MNRRNFLHHAGAAAAALAFLPGRPAYAATLPGVVNLVVPFSPGGGADQLGRDFAYAAAAGFGGSSFVVENKPGANGAIAARFVSKQQPNGGVLLLGSSSTQALGPLVMKSDVDAVQDLSPISLLAETANALAVSADSPYGSLEQYIEAARQRRLTFGSFGTGSSGHLYGLVLAGATGIQLMHVPYKGSGQAITDLLGGHVDSVFLTTSALDSLAKSNKVKVLAVTGEKRTGLFPDVPTFKERGIESLDFNGWFALFGPKGMDASLALDIARRSAAVAKDAAFLQRMKDQGYDWVGSEPDVLKAALLRSIGIYKAILAKNPISV